MKNHSQHRTAYVIAAVLAVLGLILALFVVGHQYLGAALVFLGCVIAVYRWFHDSAEKFPNIVPKLKILVSVVLLVGTGYFIFLETLILRDARTNTEPSADYIVVLGAGVNGTEPSLSLLNRLEATQDYLLEHPETVAIVSGGQGPGEDITEAQCMYDWLLSHGIESERVIRETKATSTAENLRFSMEIIQGLCGHEGGVVGIVSSEYHLHRAKQMAEDLGYVDPIGIAGKTSYPTLLINYAIREAFGLTHYYVFGY